MKVSEILDLMGTLSLGNENIVSRERALFLQYLNLAHFDLYQATAPINASIMKQDAKLSINSILTFEEENPLFLVLSVVEKKINQLYRLVSPQAALKRENQRNTYRVLGKNQIQLWKDLEVLKDQTEFETLTIPQPQPLKEDTSEQDIPYPVAYHQILADGALYYLFLDVGGFKSSVKEQEAQRRWDVGKQRLISYLYTTGGESLFTFSPV